MPVISGGGGTFNGGTITKALVIAPTDPTATALTLQLPAGASTHGNAWLAGSCADEPGNALTIDAFGDLFLTTNAADGGQIKIGNTDSVKRQTLDPNVGPWLDGAIQLTGALPTLQLVSGAGAPISTTRDAETITPCTFNPGAATTATVTVALSPDNVTYSTLAVVTEPAGVALDGTILPVKVRVPAGWYLKLTVNAQATLGLTTWY